MSNKFKEIEDLLNDGVTDGVVGEFKEAEKAYNKVLSRYVDHLNSLMQESGIETSSDEEVEELFQKTVSDFWRQRSEAWDIEDKREHLKECLRDAVSDSVPSGFYIEGNEVWESSNCY